MQWKVTANLLYTPEKPPLGAYISNEVVTARVPVTATDQADAEERAKILFRDAFPAPIGMRGPMFNFTLFEIIAI